MTEIKYIDYYSELLYEARQLPPEVVQKINDLYDQGNSAFKISKVLKIPYPNVQHILRMAGKSFRAMGSKSTITPEIEAKIVELQKQGVTMAHIAHTVGLSIPTVLKILDRYPDLHRRHLKFKNKELLDKIIDLRVNQKLSIGDIAKMFDTNPATIFRLLKKMDIMAKHGRLPAGRKPFKNKVKNETGEDYLDRFGLKENDIY